MPPTEEQLLQRAHAIHQRVIVLDSHVDFEAADLVGERNYTQRVETQFNLPNMIDGGVDALFFVVYVGQTRESQHSDAFNAAGYERAYQLAIAKFAAVDGFTRQIARDIIELALTPSDLRRICTNGKRAALMGVENGYPLGANVDRVEEFYQRGARYLSLAHNGHNQLADSHTGEREGWKWHGVSPLGRQVITELNRFGIMVDISHASKASMLQTVEHSRAPVIASHSAVRALCDVSRNLDDEQLLALKKTGGVIQMVAYHAFVKSTKPDSSERAAALSELRKEYELPDATKLSQRARAQASLKAMSPARREEYENTLAEIDHRFPADPPAAVKDFVDHIDYGVNLMGIDHVGIASDFDGGGGVIGWNDAGETFNVTLELVRRGYSEVQIEKLWGGNLLRVMDEVQRLARQMQK